MRRFHWISLGVFSFLLLVPFVSHAAVSSTFSSIIPDASSGNACVCVGSAPDWGCVLVTIQLVVNDLMTFGVVIITLFLAWTGFTYMTSGGNPEKRSLANKRLMNAVIGLLIVLCAWLIVDSIMKVLYNPNAALDASTFGPWNSILVNDGGTATDCIRQQTTPGLGGAVNQLTNTTAAMSGGTLSGTGTGACNAATVQSAASLGGVTMSATESATLACIAGPESSCGAVNQNYNWNGKVSSPPSTAWGPFQITLKGNSTCFNNSACEAAAGVSGPLNCNQAFDSNGYAIPGQLLTECQTAAANLTCSAVAADCLVQETPGTNKYIAWTGNKDSTAAHQQCISSYGGGT